MKIRILRRKRTNQLQGGIVRNEVVVHRATVVKFWIDIPEALLVDRNACRVLNLCFYVIDNVLL